MSEYFGDVRCCDEMRRFLAEGEVAVRYVNKFREFGVLILDGGSSLQEIRFCPWCGARLPLSLRDRWFDEIESLGFEPDSRNLPARFRTDQWWNETDEE